MTKGVNDPYRMMTSRCEYRLILRQDNADDRLCEKGHQIGLVSDEKYNEFLKNQRELEEEINRIRSTVIHPTNEVNDMLREKGETELTKGMSADAILKRPNIHYEDIKCYLHPDGALPSYRTVQKAEIEIKYEGYLKRQNSLANKLRKEEALRLPDDIDYKKIIGLRLEAADKLNKVKPSSFGQAARISGVNPADLQVLSVWIAKHRYEKREEKKND